MKQLNLFLLIVGSCILTSCTSHTTEQTDKFGELTFTISNLNSATGILVREAKADSTGLILITIVLSNNKEKIHNYNWLIETAEGLRSMCLKVSEKDTVLNSSPTTLLLSFKPLNDLQFFKFTNLKGDLEEHYQLYYEDTVIAKLSAVDMSYKQFISRWGIESNIRAFQQATPKDFETSQLVYLNNNLPLDNHHQQLLSHNVKVSNEELLIDGLNIRNLAYLYQDTLHLSLQLINHSPFAIRLNPNDFNITINDSAYKPQLAMDTVVIIPKSQRFFPHFKYYIGDVQCNEFFLNTTSLNFISDKHTSILSDNQLTFKTANF